MTQQQIPYLERLRTELVTGIARQQERTPERSTRRPLLGPERRRLVTIAVAIVLAAAAVGGVVTVFRSAPAERPASEITSENLSSLGLAWRTHLGGHGDPVVANGTVYVAGYRYLSAFPVACASRGRSCSPAWTGSLTPTQFYYGAPRFPTPVIGDGAVWVESGGRAEAFPVDCAGTCAPTWSMPVQEPWTASLPEVAVADGVVVIRGPNGRGLRAYSTACADGGAARCFLMWKVQAPPVSAPFIAGNLVIASTERGLEAFRARCRIDGGECDPVWTIPGLRQPTRVETTGSVAIVVTRWATVAVSVRCGSDGAPCEPIWTARGLGRFNVVGGVVYRENNNIAAFDASCADHGKPCDPIWVGEGPGPATGVTADPVVGGGFVFTVERSRLLAWPTTCAPQPGSGWCFPTWGSLRSQPKAAGSRYVQGHRYSFHSSPAVSDGIVYVTSATGEIDAFDAQACEKERSCRPAWTQRTNGSFLTSPVVADGKLFVVGRTNLYAFAPGEADARGTGSQLPLWIGGLVLGVGVFLFFLVRRFGGARLLGGGLALLLLASACSSSHPAAATTHPPSTPPSPSSSPAQKGDLIDLGSSVQGRYVSSADASNANSVTIHIVALGPGQPAFRPTVISGSPGEHLSVTVVQSDDLSAHYQHNVSIGSLGIDKNVPKGPGGTVTLDVTLPSSGPLVFFCKYHAVEFHAGEFTVG